ncbi:MAG: hypothetical protein QOG23_3926 [Blastocatellia bacterium]|nr:hypothetical protein [Blastocatellia bacterium]
MQRLVEASHFLQENARTIRLIMREVNSELILTAASHLRAFVLLVPAEKAYRTFNKACQMLLASVRKTICTKSSIPLWDAAKQTPVMAPASEVPSIVSLPSLVCRKSCKSERITPHEETKDSPDIDDHIGDARFRGRRRGAVSTASGHDAAT